MDVKVDIKVDITDVVHNLSRLIGGPDDGTLIRFEKTLYRQFQQTQRDVHVRTGSLLDSGTVDPGWDDDEWTGLIEYGGPSGGVHNPVDYAHYEQRRGDRVPPVGITAEGDEGGSHDFMGNVPAFEREYADAIMDWLEGRRP